MCCRSNGPPTFTPSPPKQSRHISVSTVVEMQITRDTVQEVYVTIVGTVPPSEEAVTEVARALMNGVAADSVRVMPYNEHGTHACVAMLLVHSRGGAVSSAQLLAAGRTMQSSLLAVTVHPGADRLRNRRPDNLASAGFLWIIIFTTFALCVI